jgi:hypothetical protein
LGRGFVLCYNAERREDWLIADIGVVAVAKMEVPTTTARVPISLVDRVVAIAGLRKTSPAVVWHDLFQAVADRAYDEAIENARLARLAEQRESPPSKRKK